MELTTEQKNRAFEWLCANLTYPALRGIDHVYYEYWLNICARAGSDILRQGHIAELEAQVAELSKDKARLDWLSDKYSACCPGNGDYRNVTDAAIAKEQECEKGRI